jgi:hypothetical protein
VSYFHVILTKTGVLKKLVRILHKNLAQTHPIGSDVFHVDRRAGGRTDGHSDANGGFMPLICEGS